MKKNNYIQIIHTLQELHKKYPSHNMGRHISSALSEYGDLWGVSDREFLFALDKYKVTLEMDYNNENIDDIIKDGMNLFNTDPLFLDDEEEEYGG